MEKRLKIGLICMLLAVIIMPIAFLFRTEQPSLTIAIIVLSMLLEIAGLVLVIMIMLRNKRNKN